MDDGLTDGAIAPAMVERRFVRRGRKRSSEFDGVALQHAVDMRLDEVALEREGKRGDEHDKAGRRTHASGTGMPR